MKTLLLVNIKGYWKQISASYSEDGYDKLMKETESLNPDVEWMIVKLLRYHGESHTETFINPQPHDND